MLVFTAVHFMNGFLLTLIMFQMKNIILALLLLSNVLIPQSKEIRKEWKSFYNKNNVKGCIVIYDRNNDEFLVYNDNRCKMAFLPASTYKIFNSLVALETGVIKDEKEIIPWDSINRQYDKWNMDQTLRSAIKYSAVWAYQVLARKIGEERMQHYVDTVEYGNCNISGGIDSFWLNGGLRISPYQQIEFLRRLYSDDLPFSKRNLNIVKDILINEKTDEYTLRGKTGWTVQDENGIGWYVGYLEENDNVYFYANNIEIKKDIDAEARIHIVKEIFKIMGLLK